MSKAFLLLLLLLIPIDILAQNSVEAKLEQERLLALPSLKQKLSDPNLRDRADMIVVLEDSFFNKLLIEAAGTKFNAGSFFTVTLENPLTDFRNGLALIKFQAVVAPTNPLLTLNSRLKVVARLLVEQGK
ncbi:MAG: hypothetical protein JNN15_03895, partial [Blastocatellia bacterium]|nr:hypothetical protein [Blastocatellia bacterium]